MLCGKIILIMRLFEIFQIILCVGTCLQMLVDKVLYKVEYSLVIYGILNSLRNPAKKKQLVNNLIKLIFCVLIILHRIKYTPSDAEMPPNLIILNVLSSLRLLVSFSHYFSTLDNVVLLDTKIFDTVSNK